MRYLFYLRKKNIFDFVLSLFIIMFHLTTHSILLGNKRTDNSMAGKGNVIRRRPLKQPPRNSKHQILISDISFVGFDKNKLPRTSCENWANYNVMLTTYYTTG